MITDGDGGGEQVLASLEKLCFLEELFYEVVRDGGVPIAIRVQPRHQRFVGAVNPAEEPKETDRWSEPDRRCELGDECRKDAVNHTRLRRFLVVRRRRFSPSPGGCFVVVECGTCRRARPVPVKAMG